MMLWVRLILVLALSFLAFASCADLLTRKSLASSQHLANQQGLKFLAGKIEQYHLMGGRLGRKFQLSDLLPHPVLRIRESHFIDPYGNPYQLSWKGPEGFELRSAGHDGIIGSGNDQSLMVILP